MRGGLSFDSWDGALGLLSGTTGGSPAVVVFDEFLYLAEQDSSMEGVLQKIGEAARICGDFSTGRSRIRPRL